MRAHHGYLAGLVSALVLAHELAYVFVAGVVLGAGLVLLGLAGRGLLERLRRRRFEVLPPRNLSEKMYGRPRG